MLVNLERDLHVPVYRGASLVQPYAIGGPAKGAKTLPKSLAQDTVAALLAAIEHDKGSARSSGWAERDRALVPTALLAGLHSDELVHANVGDIRVIENGGVIHVRGKGGKDRRVPIEQALVDIVDRYLETRRIRFAERAHRTSTGSAAWKASAPLFIGADGEHITRGTLQYRMLLAIRRAGINTDRARGALSTASGTPTLPSRRTRT